MDVGPSRQYDRTSLILYYLRVRADPSHPIAGYVTAAHEYNDLLRGHYAAVLAGLENLYGLTLAPEAIPRGRDLRVPFMMFEATAQSYLAIRYPWVGYYKALFLHRSKQPGEPGEGIDQCSRRITRLTEDLRQAYLELLDTFARQLLGERADLTFTSEDLRALGVDDQEPDWDIWALTQPS